MPSSTSPFENPRSGGEKLQRGLRMTASDRPGQAQPVPERDIPAQPWGRIAVGALIAVLIAFGIWEWQMRRLGLDAGHVTDDIAGWAVQRHRIASERIPVAIVGDSRILFDTDLDRFEALTGVRPLQLALVGTSGRPFLADLANDPKFTGLLIVGMADLSYFRDGVGLNAGALEVTHWQSPAKRVSQKLGEMLGGVSASFDEEYRLSRQLRELDRGLRPGADSPYEDVWKIKQVESGRQVYMWRRLEHDAYLRYHARHAWKGAKGPRIESRSIATALAESAASVAKIRARGGDVIFVRPPSSPELRVNEERRLPRAKGWDALLAATKAHGVHADDLPAAQDLVLPEFSHLSRACATVFTDALVRRIVTITPRLRLRPTAPRAVKGADCRPIA